MGHVPMNNVIHVENVSFTWTGSDTPALVINRFSVQKGESLFLHGASGSGKSTLLSLLAGLISPDEGRISVLGTDIVNLSNRRRDRFRAQHIGYVFQRFNLIPYLNVRANIRLAALLAGNGKRCTDSVILSLLDTLRLGEELVTKRADQLSVGQQQRVAVARAMINEPELLIADEPTSSLDYGVRDDFIALLLELQLRTGTTILFVSHDLGLQRHFGRSVNMEHINIAPDYAIEVQNVI